MKKYFSVRFFFTTWIIPLESQKVTLERFGAPDGPLSFFLGERGKTLIFFRILHIWGSPVSWILCTDVDGVVDGPASPSLSKLGPWGLDPGFGAPERALERRGAAATPPMGVRVGVECCSLRIAIEWRSGRATSLPERRVEPYGASRHHYRPCEPG